MTDLHTFKNEVTFSERVRIVLEGERPVSWNHLYSGMHPMERTKLAHEKHGRMHRAIWAMQPRPKPFTVPVTVTIVAYFDKRPLDADNITLKFYLDGMKGSVIHDDSPKYVESVTCISRIDRKRPRIDILVEPVKETA